MPPKGDLSGRRQLPPSESPCFHSVYAYVGEDKPRSAEVFDLEARKVTWSKEIGFDGGWAGFSISPAGRWILSTRRVGSGSDLMLVEDFR